MKVVGEITHDLGHRAEKPAEFSLFSHALGFGALANEVLPLLPVADFNRTTLDAICGFSGSIAANCYVGLFLADPLYRAIDLLAPIERVRALGVANFPTVGLFEGELREALDAAGYDVAREMALLQVARERGLRAAAFVTCYADGELALEIGADLLIVHPGLVSADAAANSFEATEHLVKKLTARAKSSHSRVLLFLSASHGLSMRDAAQFADGVVVHPALLSTNP